MNRQRRKSLESVIAKIEAIKTELEGLMEEEVEYRDNMPENLQGSDRYEKSDAACDCLDSAVLALEEVLDAVMEAV